jgi:hypothetical protein
MLKSLGSGHILFKGLVAVCHSFCIYLSLYIRYIYTSFIHNSFINIRWGPSPYLHSCRLSMGGTSMGCRAEIRARACLTASQRAIPTEPHCTIFGLSRLLIILKFSFCMEGGISFLCLAGLPLITYKQADLWCTLFNCSLFICWPWPWPIHTWLDLVHNSTRSHPQLI